MFSIYSSDTDTKVINSRVSKKSPLVWRRRKDVVTGQVFTTYERPSLADNTSIRLPNGRTDTFNLGRLILSIAQAFTHNRHAAQYDSLWLAQTIEDILSTNIDSPLTPHAIALQTHLTLKHFDELAAMQYAARHHLISAVRRRGRPSTAS
jgi:transcriptional regulator NrdR family protein